MGIGGAVVMSSGSSGLTVYLHNNQLEVNSAQEGDTQQQTSLYAILSTNKCKEKILMH
jgi:hypothetical protein